MIEFKDVSFSYGDKKVIEHLCFCIDKNTSIIGKSGCGKTTLLHLISGILKPDSGDVLINDENNTVYRDKIGLVAQSGGVLDFKTVQQNIALGLVCKKDKKAFVKSKEIAQMLKIDELLDKYPAEISGGQKQRVALGRVLCMSPNILLLDEPFSALDEVTRRKLQDEVKNISRKENELLLTITHSIQEAIIMGEKVIVIGDEGEILKEYDVAKYDIRDIDFYKKCIEIEKEIGDILL